MSDGGSGTTAARTAAASPAGGQAVHVLVVDDEPEIRDLLRDYLVRHEFAVSTASGGQELRRVMAERPVHVVVMDLNMPGEDGLTLASELRRTSNVGIIMLTARVEAVDRIIGLEVGADDYVMKPFDPRELLARVRSLVRRLPGAVSGGAGGSLGREVRFGRCTLNLDARKVYAMSGEEIAVTAMEFDLLQAFAQRPGRVLSRDQLLDLAHGRDAEAFDRSIDIRISRLRRKVEEDPSRPQVIRTVRGSGYIFEPGRSDR